MSNFLDNDLEPDLDTGIFDEEEEEEVAGDQSGSTPVQDEPEKSEETESLPVETPLIQDDDIVVDVETGEVIDSGPESGLPSNPAEEEEEREETLASEPEALPEETKSQIQQAMELMEFKHIKDLNPRAVKFEDCNFGDFETEIRDAQNLVDGYYNGASDVNPVQAEHDLGRLSALMVRISGAVGFFQGLAEMEEDQRRFVKSALYTELKEVKDKHSLRISDKDADHTARTMSGKYMMKKSKAVVLSKMITNFWFAMRRFIDVLEGIIIRGRSEAPLEKHAEAAVRRTPPPTDGTGDAPSSNDNSATPVNNGSNEEDYELGF